MDSATFRSPTQRYGTLAKHKRPSKILPARAFVGGNGDGQIGYAHSHGLEQAYIAPCGRFYIPGNDIRQDMYPAPVPFAVFFIETLDQFAGSLAGIGQVVNGDKSGTLEYILEKFRVARQNGSHGRSEERRVGKECVSTFRSGW